MPLVLLTILPIRHHICVIRITLLSPVKAFESVLQIDCVKCGTGVGLCVRGFDLEEPGNRQISGISNTS